MNRRGKLSDLLFRVIDEGVASLAVHFHDGAVWRERTDRKIWHPSEQIQTRGSKKVTLSPTNLLCMLFSWDDPYIIIQSDGATTLIPSGILHLGSDLIHNRGLELFDGMIYYQNRYHSQILSDIDYSLRGQIKRYPSGSDRSTKIYPNQDGIHSELSLAISEHVYGLSLECSVIAGGQRKSINLRE